MTESSKTIVVFGVTGRVGGAAARHLCRAGWTVRGISRNPQSKAAQSLQQMGIDVAAGDMDQLSSLRHVLEGAYGVFLVVNGWESGFEAEIRHGKHVADMARQAEIKHLVFTAAGTGHRGTGIAHFESKLDIEDYLNEKQIPLTTIFPPPFMELMTDSALYPQLTTWNVKFKILGKSYNVPWIATDDIGGMAAVIFAQPQRYIGKRLMPVGDWKTLDECRQVYQELAGKKPPRIPLPVWLFRRMQPDLVDMWEWLRDTDDLEDTSTLEPVSAIYENATDVRSFLQQALAQ